MIALTNAIYTAFTGNATLTAAFPGGMHPQQAPETTAMPYVVSIVTPAMTTTSYGGKHRDDVPVSFVVYGIGHDATGNAIETLDAAYIDTILTLSTGQNYDCRRTQSPCPVIKTGVDGNGKEVWTWTVSYLYSVRA